MTQQHTPTPWKFNADHSLIEAVAPGLSGYTICEGPWGIGCSEEQKANAAFIVKAVNHHDELVSVCSERLRCIELEAHNTGDDPTAIDSSYDTIRAILAKVKP